MRKPDQLLLDLPTRAAMGRDAFLISTANELAVQQIENWQDWPQGKLVLVGPDGAGKTHLAHVWAEMTGAAILPAEELTDVPETSRDAPALVIEDLDRIAPGNRAEIEEAAFHLHNLFAARKAPLLLTARAAPAHWHILLPDLASRMQACAVARLEPPDDALLAGLIIKLFADRQLRVAPDLVGYLTTRLERSFEAVRKTVAELDRLALTKQTKVTVKMAREFLDAHGA